MDAQQVLFILSAVVILFSAFRVVTTKNLVHSALWLIAALFGVAILYALLEAGFLAVVQVVVYIGAIAIMFIFAVMLTRRTMLDNVSQLNDGWLYAAGIAALFFAGLFVILNQFSGMNALAESPVPASSINDLGNALISPNAFVLPFEVASVLLLAALIGAVYVSSNKK
jgi:NADH-quinone oxidoreductase subunit J